MDNLNQQNTNPVPSPVVTAKPEEGKKRRPGAKIEESPQRDQVVTMLLMEQSNAHILRYLDKAGLPVRPETLKDFQDNYVAELAKEVKDKMLASALDEQRKRNETLVTAATYAHMSRVDTLILLIGEAESQIETIKAEPGSTWMNRQELGTWLDRVYKLRTELEEARVSSEVQMERAKAIDAVAALALKYLKDHPKVEEFIQLVDGIHRNPSKQSS